MEIHTLQDKIILSNCTEIRKNIIKMVNKGNASHLGSALSMVEILTAIYSNCDIEKIKNNSIDRDRVILSKGHGTSSLYAVMHSFGLISTEDLDTYFLDGTLLAGHATHFVNYVEHSTGALGHGLSVSLGLSIGSNSLKLKNNIFVLLGDGELHEGSNWEAIMLAGHLKLKNLIVFIDKNGLSQMGFVDNACSLNPLKDKFIAFNFDCIEIKDGNNIAEINNAIGLAKKNQLPTAIICPTIKGKGVSFMENNNLWHYKTPIGSDFDSAMSELDRTK